MKIFFVIFSFYILALSLMPCTDMANISVSAQEQFLTKDGQEVNHDHTDQEDTCSPFCACSCCGAIYVAAKHWSSFSFNPKLAFVKEQMQPHYLSLFIPNDLDSIWQPPKCIV